MASSGALRLRVRPQSVPQPHGTRDASCNARELARNPATPRFRPARCVGATSRRGQRKPSRRGVVDRVPTPLASGVARYTQDLSGCALLSIPSRCRVPPHGGQHARSGAAIGATTPSGRPNFRTTTCAHYPWPIPLTQASTPTAYASFGRSATPTRSSAERAFNIQRWTQMERGGHFAGLEAPDALASDVAAYSRRWRQR